MKDFRRVLPGVLENGIGARRMLVKEVSHVIHVDAAICTAF
jgi:hypothetical protein